MKKLFSNNQKGIGHLGLILAVVVVLAAGGAGYFVYSKNKNGGYSNATIKAALENAKCDYDDEDLCKFFTGWKALGAYSMVATTTDGSTTSTMSVKSEGDDKSHVKLTGEMDMEIVTIGDATYTKAADGTWWKQTQTTSDESTNYNDDIKTAFDEPSTTAEADKTSYKKLGKEKCGELNCFKYQVVDPADTANDSYLWFDDRDYQLRRTQTVSKDGKTNFDAIFSYDDVNIKEPSPVKELGPNQYLTPGATEPTTIPEAGDIPTEEEIQQLMEQYQ
jgi:hypothetical protein